MRKIALVGALSIVLLGQASLTVASPLKTDTDKFSYIVGLNIGKSFKAQDIQVNTNLLMQGMHDGMSGATPLLTQDQQRDFMQSYQKAMAAKIQANMKKDLAANQAAGDKFLAANAKKAGVKTTASGLQYKVLEAGTGASPSKDAAVTVDYEGTLIDGKVFDSSYKRGQPASFKVSQVIPGWTEALQMMQPGATWMLYIPAKLAYGDQAMGGLIPAGSTLVFKVHLRSVNK